MRMLRARISVVPEGDLGHDGFSGMRPSFNLDGDPITSEVHSAQGERVLAKGKDHDVVVTLPYGEILGDKLRVGASFVLQVGGRMLATGNIVEVVE